jgi:hypothetical protein
MPYIMFYGVQVQGHDDSPLETRGLQKQHTKRFIDKSAYWEKAKLADTFYFADAFEVWWLGSLRKETESSRSEKDSCSGIQPNHSHCSCSFMGSSGT